MLSLAQRQAAPNLTDVSILAEEQLAEVAEGLLVDLPMGPCAEEGVDGR